MVDLFAWADENKLETPADIQEHRDSLCALVWQNTIATYESQVVGWLMSADFYRMTQPAFAKNLQRRKTKPHHFIVCDGYIDQKTVKPILSLQSNQYIMN